MADRLRSAFAEWEANEAERRPDSALHTALVRHVLLEVLGYPADYITEGPGIDPTLAARIPEHRVTLRPDFAVGRPGERPVLLVNLTKAGVRLERPIDERGFHASPAERMRLLLRESGIRSGLVTNGREWLLVHVPAERTTTFVTWHAGLFVDERVTLRAFRSLLGVRRLFGVSEPDTLNGLLERSGADEREVTDQLGVQALRAVELIVKAFDEQDRVNEGRLLKMYSESKLYEASLVVVMRLIFLLAAEAQRLLPEETAWIEGYAVSPLRSALQEIADRDTLQTLERRFDAWPRLLATFRAVHGGVSHARIRMPGYGGGLFDPSRYPFLESAGDVTPRISNRTILHVLDALQTLEVAVPGGRERRPLSFSGIGVEQVGHVYERLLDHTAVRANAPAVGLGRVGDKSGDLALELLEKAARTGDKQLLDLLVDETGRSRTALARALRDAPKTERLAALRVACAEDSILVGRLRPFLGLIRSDAYEAPVIYLDGHIYVAESSGRRASGAHYTPRSLTEPIVEYALEPVVYRGPAEGKPRDEWALRSPMEILELKICDVAMGSGAFLAAACRYLADRLVEAWDQQPGFLPVGAGADAEERTITARRLVAERCLYGVDVNPLAVEIAKVSLWLVTLRRDRPFTFLDHALRKGDALVGIVDVSSLGSLSLRSQGRLLSDPAARAMRETLAAVTATRAGIGETDALDLREIEVKAAALERVRRDTEVLRAVADLVVGTEMSLAAGVTRASDLVERHADSVIEAVTGVPTARIAAKERVAAAAAEALTAGRAPGGSDLVPFHWGLEFPEVFLADVPGFDAIVGNPPFLGGKKISGVLGGAYREYLVQRVASGRRGNADLVAYFFLRAASLCRTGGCLGLLGTNSIAQGETRQVALDPMVEEGWGIFRAIKSAPWPGEAALYVSHVWAYHGTWQGGAVLNSLLDPLTRVHGDPLTLQSNRGRAFLGVLINGAGFVLEPEEARRMLEAEPECSAVVRPYLTGEDITAGVNLASPRRWVIDFTGLSEEQARRYGTCFAITRDRVKPWRDQLLKKPRVRSNWWLYEVTQVDMRRATAGLARVLVGPRTTKYWFVTEVENRCVFTADVVIFGYQSAGYAAVLSSTFHEAWARKYSGTLKFDLRYSPTECFDNFPFPKNIAGLEGIGQRYLERRQETLVAENQGPTTVHNRIHEQPDDQSPRIQELRQLRRELDRHVADTYGWTNLVLDHDFRETELGLRYTLSDAVRNEALDRLLEWNHERHAEEVSGAAAATSKAGAKKAKSDSRQIVAEAAPLPWGTP